MRIVIDSLIALMLVGVVACLVMLHRDREQGEHDVAKVKDALDRLHEQAAYHTAVQSAMAGQDTLLVHLHAEWFGEDLPTNVLLSAEHPWIDLAPPGDLGVHPPDPVVTDGEQAGFWYNPTTGMFRARVTPRSTEAQTLALYNRVNETSLDAFEQIPDPSRRPIAHVPGTTPARQYASMANQTWSVPEPDASEANEQVFAPLIATLGQDDAAEPASAPVPVDGVYEAHDGAEGQGQASAEPRRDEPADEPDSSSGADQPRPKLGQ